MGKRILWVVVSGLMVLSLVAASCGPAAVPPAPATPAATTTPAIPQTQQTLPTPAAPAAPTKERPQQETVKSVPEAPKYGGWYQLAAGDDPTIWDEKDGQSRQLSHMYLVYSFLLTGDWTKGPAGTNENDWNYNILGQVSMFTGNLAKSWEVVKPDTIVFHIRPGVKWQNKQPVNGRELTADDVVWSFNRHTFDSPLSTMYQRYPAIGKPPKITKLDKYTVEIKVAPDMLGYSIIMFGAFTLVWPREVADRYGDFRNWRNAIGTGPFMLTDLVPGSIRTFVRNPDYWEKDPVGAGKGKQLPYLDGYKVFVLPDVSTRQAAFRTGKIDNISLSWTDYDQMVKLRPEVIYKKTIGGGSFLAGRMDKPDLPFKDVRVRYAMNMAIDKQAIVDNYYGGHAELFAQPVPPSTAHRKMFTPFELQSEAVKSLFTYNPEKAKQLLKEAGYPNGFKVTVDTSSTNIDVLSIYKDYFARVGIELVFKINEAGAQSRISNQRTFSQMSREGNYDSSFPQSMLTVTGTYGNPAYYNYEGKDERVNKAVETVMASVGFDDELWQKTLKEFYPYLLEQAPVVWEPVPYSYNAWWPWVKNYHGEGSVGYFDPPGYYRYIWIDQELKKRMGH